MGEDYIHTRKMGEDHIVGHVKLFNAGQLISKWGKIIYSYENLDLLH
jgi:hypothetical protein